MWQRHYNSTGHALQAQSEGSNSPKNSSDEESAMSITESRQTLSPHNPSNEMAEQSIQFDPIQDVAGLSDSEESSNEEDSSDDSTGDNSDEETATREDHDNPWFPWLSRSHFYLTVLYHGSHNRKISQTILRAFMDILKIYVQDSEYFPTVQEVIQFRNEFWESKLFESRVEDSNVFSF